MANLRDTFEGCLLGAMLGDVVGAVVEGESRAYIRKHFTTADDLLNVASTPEPFGPDWIVGRFTDDTQMLIGVAEWLARDENLDGLSLLRRFARNHEPWRRYGPGTRRILEAFNQDEQMEEHWRGLATLMFSHGSYGNGSAMRAAPIGLRFHAIASMTGALSAAYLGARAIPEQWIAAVKEERHTPTVMRQLAGELVDSV